MRYDCIVRRTVTESIPPWIDGDPPIFTTTAACRRARRIVAPNRTEALRLGRGLYGDALVGVEAVDVSCSLCDDGNEYIGNAARWTDPAASDAHYCPRCGR